MGKVTDIANRLKSLTVQRLEAETLKSIQKNEEVAVNMNTDQLFAGEDALKQKLPDYSERSVTVFGKKSGPMTLFETGDFYRGFFVDAKKFPVVFGSNDQKTGKIADLLASKGHNPDDIYGLQKENVTDLAKSYVLEDLKEWFRGFIHV